MVRRHRNRARKKYHGGRRWGGGNIKNRRGKGSKGGKGYAGSMKHNKARVLKYEPDHFSHVGFAALKREKMKTLNVWEINSMAEKGKLEKNGERFALEFDGKVLGAGELILPVSVKARAFSEAAKEKITSAGGEALAAAEEQETKKKSN